ncbi:HD domain-containing protein [Flexibacter flexilis]|nr:hypothetical protein [Flexibacter flexilis]
MLKDFFFDLIRNYTDNENTINYLWNEIEKNYSNHRRYYHTLQHLENLLVQLVEVKEKIQNWNIILFSIYYHDAIYNVLKSDNEQRSAALAEKRMLQIGVDNQIINICKMQIMATQSHAQSADNDTNYFTDADLSVLGQSWNIYEIYYKNVRKEYIIYPDIIYNSGRKKVLHHFLSMDRIFKTEFFNSKLENQAKENLQKELYLLK